MIILPAQIESIATRKDGTIRVAFGTQELMPSAAGDLFSLTNKSCYVAIKIENFRDEEKKVLDELKADEDGFKSPSQRLRGVLYRLFESKPDGFKTFALFYDSKMEQIINHLKNQIDK